MGPLIHRTRLPLPRNPPRPPTQLFRLLLPDLPPNVPPPLPAIRRPPLAARPRGSYGTSPARGVCAANVVEPRRGVLTSRRGRGVYVVRTDGRLCHVQQGVHVAGESLAFPFSPRTRVFTDAAAESTLSGTCSFCPSLSPTYAYPFARDFSFSSYGPSARQVPHPFTPCARLTRTGHFAGTLARHRVPARVSSRKRLSAAVAREFGVLGGELLVCGSGGGWVCGGEEGQGGVIKGFVWSGVSMSMRVWRASGRLIAACSTWRCTSVPQGISRLSRDTPSPIRPFESGFGQRDVSVHQIILSGLAPSDGCAL